MTEEMINHEGPRRTTKRMGAWRRIRHHAATVAAWGLVLLAVGVVGLWVDSIETRSHIGYSWGSRNDDSVRNVFVTSGKQRFLIWHLRWGPSENVGTFHSEWHVSRGNEPERYGDSILEQSPGFLGWFGLGREVSNTGATANSTGLTMYWLMFPHWFLLLLLLPWPAKRGWGWLKLRRRRRKGLCLHCGYDLRASPERCPECGMERRKS
jgi:hypothetical protein